MGKGPGPRHPIRIRAAERNRQIVDLRLRGWAPIRIAQELGISRQRVHQVLNLTWDAREAEIKEGRGRLRAREAERLEAAGARLWDAWEAGDMRAAELWHRNRAQYAKLLGLDLTEGPQVEQHLHVHTPQVVAYDREIARLLRERAQATGALEDGGPAVIEGSATES